MSALSAEEVAKLAGSAADLQTLGVAQAQIRQRHLEATRFGGAVTSSFISRIWQPRSVNTSGDAAVTFGIAMATDMGWNVFREFWPNVRSRFKRP